MDHSSPVAAPPRARPLPGAELPIRAFSTERKIRFSHCDPAGIVYTPRFVDLMNGVVEDFFSDRLGFDYHGLIRDERLGLGYAQLHCEFFRPALMGDALDFTLLVRRVGRGSIGLRIHAHRGEHEIVRGEFTLVTTNLDRHKPTPIPDAIRDALLAYIEACR